MATTTVPSAPERIQRPPTTTNLVRWLRKNLFNTWFDALLTVIVLAFALNLGIQFVQWVTSEAQWAVVTENFRGLMQGLYPISESWRPALSVLIITSLAGISWGVYGVMTRRAVGLLIGGTVLFVILPIIDRQMWGESILGNYLSAQLIPLLNELRLPVVLLTVCLIGGYAVGRLLKQRNYVTASRLALIGWLLSIPVTFILVRGITQESAVLPLVPTNLWGGLLLTFMLAFVAIVCCFPLGVLLALGRVSGGPPRSQVVRPALWWASPQQWWSLGNGWWKDQGNYPVIKLFCTVYIEFLRGVPLVTVFFAASYIVPFALGIESSQIEAAVRAMVALTLFEAAYVAEIVRGGLQALPPGQMEAAKALGLSPIQAIGLIILPQALRLVIPALVGQFITMFKDTSLVVLIGLLDLLNTAQSLIARQEFSGRSREMLLFVALVYFVFCFGMSRAARQLERSGSGRLRRTL